MIGNLIKSPNMYEIKAFHCSYCKKYSSAKSVITKHEPKCFYNPITRSCVTCVHLLQKTQPIGEYPWDTMSVPVCEKEIPFESKPIPGLDPLNRYKLNTNCHVWTIHPDKIED